jgi:PAS domain S-box-containing protein
MSIAWTIILIVTSVILMAVGAYAWRRRSTAGTASFSLLTYAIALNSLTYALELLAPDLPDKMLWVRAEYPFIVAAPVLWFIFALQYTGRGRWLTRRSIAILALVPVATVLVVWTNQLHHLYYTHTTIQESGPWTLLEVEYGLWFWVHITFSYLCLLGGTLLLALSFLRAPRLHRKQAAVLLIGALIPWIGNLLYLSRVMPWPYLDLTPLSFGLSGLVVAFGLFRYRLLQVIPVARRAVVEQMPTAMIVVDAQGRIADLNPAARFLFSLESKSVLGKPALKVLGPAEVVAGFAGVTHADEQISVGEGAGRRIFQVTIRPLDEDQPGTPPRLILISDTTAQVLAQEKLAHSNRHLMLLHDIARAAASTLDLQDLYQILADTLARIIGGDGCYITHVDEESGQVVGRSAYGALRESYSGIEPPPGARTLTESVLEVGQPIAVADVFNSPHISPRIAEMFPARSQLGLPLRVGDRALGAVLIAFNDPHFFTEEEITWTTQAVDLAALALENAGLFQRMEQGKRDWEATFDAMPDLICILDDEHNIVRANRAMAARLGVEPEGVVGLACYHCIHGAEEPLPHCPHSQLLADGKEHTSEIYEENLGGTFLIGVSPIHDAEGQLVGAVHVARDITARKQAEEEREELIRELQKALAQVKTLSGLLPICANCKKIRDDLGYWHSVEVYVRDHSDADFSHGICPDCVKALYPWYEDGEEPAE